MQLIPDAGKVITRAWSLRFIGLSIALQGAAEAIPYFIDSIPPGPVRVLAVATTGAAAVARLIHQKGLKNGE